MNNAATAHKHAWSHTVKQIPLFLAWKMQPLHTGSHTLSRTSTHCIVTIWQNAATTSPQAPLTRNPLQVHLNQAPPLQFIGVSVVERRAIFTQRAWTGHSLWYFFLMQSIHHYKTRLLKTIWLKQTRDFPALPGNSARAVKPFWASVIFV